MRCFRLVWEFGNRYDLEYYSLFFCWSYENSFRGSREKVINQARRYLNDRYNIYELRYPTEEKKK